MKCPVCGKKSQHIQCPDCGFDSSRDYEKYPTLVPVKKAQVVSALQKKWQTAQQVVEKPKKKKNWLPLLACAAMLVIGIAIGIGFGGEKVPSTEPSESVQIQVPPETSAQSAQPETTEAAEPVEMFWKNNILQSDNALYYQNGGMRDTGATVFGSEYRRDQIGSVTFLDNLTDAPEDAWDVSAFGDGNVLAWVTPNEELYDLYIGAEGGVSAGESCDYLFCDYINVQKFNFADNFHTENVTTMRAMFVGCSSMTSLDLSRFDTSNVIDMGAMFFDCASLTSLDLSSFDTSNVLDMGWMFVGCVSLTSLDLSNFDTSNVQNMASVFRWCTSLTNLDLRSFNMTNVQDTSAMFYNCPAGDDWQHLLK